MSFQCWDQYTFHFAHNNFNDLITVELKRFSHKINSFFRYVLTQSHWKSHTGKSIADKLFNEKFTCHLLIKLNCANLPIIVDRQWQLWCKVKYGNIFLVHLSCEFAHESTLSLSTLLNLIFVLLPLHLPTHTRARANKQTNIKS